MQATEKGYRHVNGVELYFETFGAGPPLVLIHGGGGSIHHDYSELTKRLRGRFRLIGIDLQNHGRSGHRDIPETFEQDAHDVITLLDELGVEKASFMGFSNGGNTVLQIGYSYPDRVGCLIVASAFYKRNGMADGFFEGMEKATIDQMPQSLKDNFLQLNDDVSQLQNMFDKDSQRMIHFQDWDDRVLSSLPMPVLFIAGDQDVVKPEHTLAMARLVPQARVMMLPCGHGDYMMAGENGLVDHALVDQVAIQIVKFSNTIQT